MLPRGVRRSRDLTRRVYVQRRRDLSRVFIVDRDPDMISITSAPAAPPPRISILDKTGQVVDTVRIGDELTFRIEIPSNSESRALTLHQRRCRDSMGYIKSKFCSSKWPKFPGIFH